MPFKPGQSGNPAGRPRKGKALTEILQTAGAKTLEYDGKRITGKRLIAHLLWQAATAGAVIFPDGRSESLDMEGWLDVVKWLYTRLDGAPTQAIDIQALSVGLTADELAQAQAELADWENERTG
jgi:hypothetical protein